MVLQARIIVCAIFLFMSMAPCQQQDLNITLISNGNFEKDETGWDSWSGEEHVVTGAGINESKACFIPGHTDHLPRRVVDRLVVSIEGGQKYKFTVNMRTSGNGGRARANIYWFDSSGSIIGDTQIICSHTSTSPWKKYVKTWIAPNNAVHFNMHLRVFHHGDNIVNDRCAWFDNISVVVEK